MAAVPSHPRPTASAEIVADVARERQMQQMREIDGLDLKAATLLGFSVPVAAVSMVGSRLIYVAGSV